MYVFIITWGQTIPVYIVFVDKNENEFHDNFNNGRRKNIRQ